MAESEESLATPDSTTKEQKLGFCHGDDVLLQHKDGKYYLGTIVEVSLLFTLFGLKYCYKSIPLKIVVVKVDLARERCLVKFLDNTSSWSLVKDLTKLSMPDSDVMCVLCKRSQPKTDNDIVVCDKCGRGYHQHCHQVIEHMIFSKRLDVDNDNNGKQTYSLRYQRKKQRLKRIGDAKDVSTVNHDEKGSQKILWSRPTLEKFVAEGTNLNHLQRI